MLCFNKNKVRRNKSDFVNQYDTAAERTKPTAKKQKVKIGKRGEKQENSTPNLVEILG